jgi:hypothetical protein
MRKSQDRKQYWDEGQELHIMEKGKQCSEIKRKIGRRKRLRRECWKEQKPQNYIH